MLNLFLVSSLQKIFPDTINFHLENQGECFLDELHNFQLVLRSETDEEIEGRLARMEYELSHKDVYDYILVNDDLEKAIEEMKTLLDNEKNK